MAKRFFGGTAEQRCLRVLIRHRAAVLRLVELEHVRVRAPATPRTERGVAHDHEQPGARARPLLPAETVEILERAQAGVLHDVLRVVLAPRQVARSEEHTSELQSPCNLVCRLLLEKKKNIRNTRTCNNQ